MTSKEERTATIEALKGAKKYTWGGVIDFLQDHQHSIAEREAEWVLEKQELQLKITSLESDLKAQENINRDLLKRVKMLEYALKQERNKYGKYPMAGAADEGDIQLNPGVGSTTAMESINEAKDESEGKLAVRKAQRHRDMLKK